MCKEENTKANCILYIVQNIESIYIFEGSPNF